MKLDDNDKRMLDGEQGPSRRMAMEMLVALGKIYGAEKLVPVKSAHVAGLSYRSHGDAGMEWIEKTADEGAKVVIPTTMNVIGVDRSRDLGLPKEWCRKQLRINDGYMRTGCYGTSSCVPYLYGFVPRFGEHIAWAESSAVVFTNSFLGARDNREGGPSAFAAALTGKTPLYGLHLDGNRLAGLKIRVTAKIEDLADVGAMGAYVGKYVGVRIPAFTNLRELRLEEHVYLGAALASSGGVAMYHVEGQTPDALFRRGDIYLPECEEIELGARELEEGYNRLTSGKDRQVDYVAIGCPHLSLNQVAEVAARLEGKKVKDGVTMWVHTNIPVKAMAERLGYAAVIERAGAVLTQDLCTILSIPEALGLHTLATNSAKMAFYAPGSNRLATWFGPLKACVDAAVTGVWKGRGG